MLTVIIYFFFLLIYTRKNDDMHVHYNSDFRPTKFASVL